jgi:hypothetical protein
MLGMNSLCGALVKNYFFEKLYIFFLSGVM